MKRIRFGGPENVVRPYHPTQANDPHEQQAEALDHIAKALSAIDHNLEVLVSTQKAQAATLGQIAHMLPGLLQKR